MKLDIAENIKWKENVVLKRQLVCQALVGNSRQNYLLNSKGFCVNVLTEDLCLCIQSLGISCTFINAYKKKN